MKSRYSAKPAVTRILHCPLLFPDPAQTTTINSIYYAVGDSSRPKSHDTGVAARVGRTPPRNSVPVIRGPTMIDWTKRRLGFPRLENVSLHGGFPPCARRLKLWLGPMCLSFLWTARFDLVKLHTHGAPERNASMLLGEPMRLRRTLRRLLRRPAREGLNYYYVTAREMADLVHQAERGGRYADFLVAKLAQSRY